MKLIKVLSVLVVCFVILSNSLIIGYAADVSEPDPDEVIMYGLTHSELLEYGYIYYGDGAYGLSPGVVPIEAMMPSLLTVSEPKYPNFDPRKLPWGSAPSYIQDIIYMGLSKAQTTSLSEYRMPFIGISVRSFGIDVYVGVNVGLGYATSSGAVRICYIVPAATGNNAFPDYHCCYKASFDFSYNMTSDWSPLSSNTWGDTGRVQTYNSSSFFAPSWNVDIYLYGGNGVDVRSNLSSSSIPSTSSANVLFTLNNSIGFGSGIYFHYMDTFSELYASTFIPPSISQIENELIQEGNSLQEEQNEKLDDIINATGVPDSIVDDYNKAESDLVDDYNPDNIDDDLDIQLDSSALGIVWWFFNEFTTVDNEVFTLFISIMSVGIIALILGR